MCVDALNGTFIVACGIRKKIHYWTLILRDFSRLHGDSLKSMKVGCEFRYMVGECKWQ
jgi:hypothetical protein